MQSFLFTRPSLTNRYNTNQLPKKSVTTLPWHFYLCKWNIYNQMFIRDASRSLDSMRWHMWNIWLYNVIATFTMCLHVLRQVQFHIEMNIDCLCCCQIILTMKQQIKTLPNDSIRHNWRVLTPIHEALLQHLKSNIKDPCSRVISHT